MSHPEAPSELRPVGAAPWRDALREAVVPFLAWRVVLFGVAAFVNSYLLPGFASRGLEAHGLDVLTKPWDRFDSVFYLRIAEHGYSADAGREWAFYPLFPTLVRGLATVLGGGHTATLVAALLIANLAAAGAAFVLYLLVRAEWGRDVARRTAMYFAVMPFGFYLAAPYAESLFLLLVVATLALTRRHSWIAAGVVGALAAATRPAGITLVAVLLCELVVVVRRDRADGARTQWARPVIGTALVPTGLLAFLVVGKAVAGDWLTTFHVSDEAWGRKLAAPWTAIRRGFETAGWGHPGEYLFGLMNLAVLAVWLVGLLLMARRFRPTYTVFTFVLLVPSVTSNLLQSLGRQSLPLVTLLVLLATFTKSASTTRHQLVLVGFSGLCAVFLTCYVLRVPAIA